MSELALTVKGLGKSYRKTEVSSSRTFRDEIMSAPRKIWEIFTKRSNEDETWALKDVTFDVPRGEVLALIGRNGAGKSTLLKILSRIMDPSEGSADIHGRLGALLEVGTGFHSELTGRENIYLSGALLGMKRREVKLRLTEIVAFAGLETSLDKVVKHYSSGMYARLAFSVAAHLNSDVLLVDEVLSVGDFEFQRRCVNKIGKLGSDGRTVLVVSHDLNLVRRLATRGIVLDGGRIAYDGEISKAIMHMLDNTAKHMFNRWQTVNGNNSMPRFREAWAEQDECTISGGVGLKIWLKIRSNKAVSGVSLGVGIDDEYGGRLATVYSPFSGVCFNLNTGDSVFSCTICDLPLRPGCYMLSLHMGIGPEVIDHIEHALAIEIDASRVRNFKIMPNREQGAWMLEQNWRPELLNQ
jgi:lipopolysaccharide transport system ATP-binding protein